MLIRNDIREFIAQVRENRRKRFSCAEHFFEPPDINGTHDRRVIRCCKCGGEMSRTDLVAYLEGYAHAGGDKKKVAPWWTE